MDTTTMTMINMGITAAVSIILPFALLFLWKRKNKKIRLTPFLIGLVIFMAFVMVLEPMCHQYFLVGDTGIQGYINSNTWAYVLYGALAAGIFEETGRFLSFKFLMKSSNAREDAVTYGIGHGGAESVILVGFSMLSSILLMQAIISMGGMEAYVMQAPAESQEMMRESLNAMFATEPYVYLLAGVERIATVFFHIALSVIVFIGAKRPGKWYFYPAGIVLHAFLDMFAVMYQKNVISSIWVTEMIIVIVSAATVFFAYKLYQKDGEEYPETTGMM